MKIGCNKTAEEYIEEARRHHQARKQREQERRREDLEQKEANFCPYVNGPNKQIGLNKELHDCKTKHHLAIAKKDRKRWQVPPSMPPILGSKKSELPVFSPDELEAASATGASSARIAKHRGRPSRAQALGSRLGTTRKLPRPTRRHHAHQTSPTLTPSHRSSYNF